MNRHLRLNHGILKPDSTPSDNTVLGNVKDNTGYLFFHRVIIHSLKRKIHLLIAKKNILNFIFYFSGKSSRNTRGHYPSSHHDTSSITSSR